MNAEIEKPMDRDAIVVEVRELEKNYGWRKALDGVSFAICRGEVFGLLGPNGAGKTTAVNILSTLLEADHGQATVCGYDLIRERARARAVIGVAPQEIALYDHLSALENLLFWGSLYRPSKKALREKAGTLLNLIGLWERRNDPVKEMSGGMKRRLNLAVALLNDPEFIILDEPTVGIDVQTRREIYRQISGLREKGAAILYTTHHLEEAERLCDRVAIINEGRILATGAVAELVSAAKHSDPGSSKLEDLFIELTGSEIGNSIA
ncbi:MAG: ABC transporter ATP-binding protein [Acidobacteria bacterium]|nr:ABC transporter ATP-binding protein [Acidobacteriota bacterium]